MTHPNKRKGNGFERELVNESLEYGLPAQRAYASNGESLGKCKECDVIVGGKSLQARRIKSLAKKFHIPEDVDAVVMREDRGETYVLVRWMDWLTERKFDALRNCSQNLR